MQAELERTEAALNEALAKTGQAEGNVDKEAARRAAAEAESERVRGELERLRNEIVERVLEVRRGRRRESSSGGRAIVRR